MSQPEGPPTPSGLPFFGNGLSFYQDPFTTVTDWAAEGDLVRLTFPGRTMYMISSADLVKEVLHDNRDAYVIGQEQQDTFSDVVETGLSGATGEQWKALREGMQAAFTPDRITEYGSEMPEITAEHVGTWNEGQQFTLIDEMRLLSTHLLADTLFGVDIDGHEQTVLDASDALFKWGDFRRPGQALPSWVPTVAQYRFNNALGELNAYVADVLAESSPGDENVSSVLLDARESGLLSMKEVQDNLTGLLMAGHESSAVTLTLAWYELSRRPETLARLSAEVETVADGNFPGIDDVDALTLANNVIKETLRLYPPVWSVNRQTTTDIELGGYRLPEGTQLMLPQWAVHRDDRYWENPATYDPSRWEGDVDRPEYAYYPFSGGPRHCIGMRFARTELVIALATMAHTVELDTTADEPLSFVPSITLRPETPITATVSQIQQ